MMMIMIHCLNIFFPEHFDVFQELEFKTLANTNIHGSCCCGIASMEKYHA